MIGLGEILKRTMQDMKRISELTRRREELLLYTVSEEEFRHFSMATEFPGKELGINTVYVFRADDKKRYDPENQARRARLGKPGIYLE